MVLGCVKHVFLLFVGEFNKVFTFILCSKNNYGVFFKFVAIGRQRKYVEVVHPQMLPINVGRPHAE